ncbi:hypothetical protein MUU72_04360 [Streptomyces sp. RS10V-4]|uniref:hypothetical protein n=1 Tax=Streptomyces rhizoryzae TaxID=2932493 RepID=UPI00200465CE|nr:hypothetical protein [Streptomyces rhizoryzae]MCK7622361.1 hypothetical protein [Streptomyces rhizoryzae]
MAGTTSSAPRPGDLTPSLRRCKALAYLTWARLLQHTIAGEHRRKGHVARRNRAISAAHDHGIHKTTLARTLHLSEATIGQAIKGHPTND